LVIGGNLSHRAWYDTWGPSVAYTAAENRDLPEDVLEWFETIAIAYNRGRLDKELADESFSYYVNRWWIIAKPYIEEQRRRRR
jgi:hypothetical protein